MASTRPSGSRPAQEPIPHRVANWLWTRLSRPGPLRPTAGGGLLTVLASVAVSIAAVGPLGSEIRIRWSVGTSYGPEHAPTLLVLATFPALVAIALVGFRGLSLLLERTDEFDAARGYYELAALLVLLALVLTQVATVTANLL
ncbi:hypothetical protein ACFO5R_12630 [Halosolutus amylolyticus]|uniref:Yip1 domain-containing protein n=1 Tax=Halosolutus amylolyticus TaxID=2932267 RepID=A0ABD5PQM2_9EURY|nr:hypothetical protein [Halosolutus amylolyticus]